MKTFERKQLLIITVVAHCTVPIFLGKLVVNYLAYGSMAAFFVKRIKVNFYVETIWSFQVAILVAASGNYLIRAAKSTLSELG